jgi:phosphatidylserine/phosphatidylglycerophosphate/cardiolipin synthase-like enzyme
MEKKNFYLLFFLIILFFSIFLMLIYLDANQRSNTQKEKPLNLGQRSEELSFWDLNSTIYFCPEDNCQELILSLIQDANKTIDCAIYDITSREIADALISEKQEGTEIRIVTDKGRSQTKSSLVGHLKAEGINVLISSSENSYMHNKFCVFDNNISLIASTNFTNNSFFESYNNILVFKNNPELSEILKEKIDSFYLGNFSKSSSVLGKTFDENFSIYFCPNDNCKTQVLNQISAATESIVCMMYSFTLDDFGDALVEERKTGTNIKVILETQQTSQYSEYQKLKAEGIEVIEDNQPYLMHNKFCVFDGKVLTTGSMNFSNNGTNNNDETLLIIKDQNLSEKYLSNFNSHWQAWNNQVN